jgi:pimeloyl-ACP methyl ester carboxylesterase
LIDKVLRTYGKPPFKVAVIHGGPGAPGEMAPVARELAPDWGVLEPLQTAPSLAGQVEELKVVLEQHADLPITLIGFSWGAWLSFILAANHPTIVKSLILVGSGGYKEQYAANIQETRLNRLNDEDRREAQALAQALRDPANEDKSATFARFGALCSQADAYDPIEHASDIIDVQVEVFQSVWEEAADLRSSGKLLALGKQIQCPVTAIHGDYDPHPAEGVRKPLSAILNDFRFILLKHCGHKPWIERQARQHFYAILRDTLRSR